MFGRPRKSATSGWVRVRGRVRVGVRVRVRVRARVRVGAGPDPNPNPNPTPTPNKVLVVTFGVLVLGDPISATSGFGVCIAIGGGLWYAQERKRLDEATRRGGGDGDNAEQKKES